MTRWPVTCRSCLPAAGPDVRRCATCWPIVLSFRCAPGWSSDSPGGKDNDGGALSRLVAEAATGGPAGDFWSYTNVGWCVRRVIETAAGAGWEDAMRRHLFGRAGMSETAFVSR